MEAAVLESILHNPHGEDFAVGDIQNNGDLTAEEDAVMRRLGALGAHAYEHGQVYVHISIPEDPQKPFRFVINPAPDKDVLLEDTLIALRGKEGPKISLHSIDSYPGCKFAVAFTSKEIMADS